MRNQILMELFREMGENWRKVFVHTFALLAFDTSMGGILNCMEYITVCK